MWTAVQNGVSFVPDCREYCQFETFNASCQANQVVVIEEARYGRLQLGRCVTRDYGFLGCSANVLDLLDRTCSGHQSCQYNIPKLRDLVQPCPKDLTSYLEASYSCVNGNFKSADNIFQILDISFLDETKVNYGGRLRPQYIFFFDFENFVSILQIVFL